ncbi:hypothetical protein PVK06_002652 [Gossypium arboreum]|uniref:Plastocyanin-like domain-containing protein n=1 Tax=Gossypium arboreum TaxID=29729 RepID=A0ABR0R5G6_GOSAR|nr:hypothetical protein PVK06_002652 [Gossypium arboreum]
MKLDSYLQLFFLGCFYFSWFLSSPAEAVRKYQFDIRVKNVSRLCHAKPIVTVNGRFPRPTIYAREGDRVLVNMSREKSGDGRVASVDGGLKFGGGVGEALIREAEP